LKAQGPDMFDTMKLHKIPELLWERYGEEGPLPHLHLRILHRDKCVLDSVAGSAREDGAPLQKDALYRIASMTKPITSLAFLILMERRLVALDTPVMEIVPEFAGLEVFVAHNEDGGFKTRPLDRPMLMLDLLRHTSGLTYSFQQRTAIDALYTERQLDAFHQKRDPETYLQALAELPLEFSPGDAWNYSVSTDVLGIVVERLSGLDLAEFLTRTIFVPLNMQDTFFVVPSDKLDRMTDAWMIKPDGGIGLYDRGQSTRWRFAPATYSGGGGLVSSVDDYSRFASMLLNGGTMGGVRIVQPETIALMTRNHLPHGEELMNLSVSMFSESGNEGIGFGLGVSVAMDPARNPVPASRGEYRWGGLLSTSFLVDPKKELVVVMMTQLLPSSATTIRARLNRLIHGALL
jgi:CubicO group peptidase (beta-lactamase class C family)